MYLIDCRTMLNVKPEMRKVCIIRKNQKILKREKITAQEGFWLWGDEEVSDVNGFSKTGAIISSRIYSFFFKENISVISGIVWLQQHNRIFYKEARWQHAS